jgi:hypothetical protein
MQRKQTPTPDWRDEQFAQGAYLTDGTSLFNIVGELPHEPSLRLVEDCSTLEILMVHVDGLCAPGVREVHATAPEPEERQTAEPSFAHAGAPSAANAHR